ncbi:gp58-like family protein, partial [Limosilactobacillus reuteri]
MAENNQLSDETKNNSTDTSSTDASSAVIGNHENAVVPHKISNHDKLVQTMVMVDGEWINVNDTNDQANMKEDMNKVNKKVAEAQKGIVEAKSAADSAAKAADSAVSASKVNSDAIVAQSSAISEAKAAADDAASKAQFIKENASSEAAAIRNQVADVANNVSSVKADVASATSDVDNLKVDVQANSAAIIRTNEAVSVQSKSSSDAINELKIANGQVESIAKDAKNNATVAKQTADTATTLAQDAKSNAVLATQTATSATVEATNATSTATKAELSVNGLTTRVTAVEGDNKKLSNQFISTETILQQAKDQLLKKADKSVVDQANNLISQLSAEQKTMADQINQKVSSAEYQTLRDKVNGIQVGTSNLLHHSDTFDGWIKGYSVTVTADKYLDGRIAILGGAGANGGQLTTSLDGPYNDDLVTWVVYARAENAGDKMHTELWGGGGYTDQSLTTKWQSYKFSGHRNINYPYFYLWGCVGNKGNIYVALPFAVVGNYIGTWLANPTDTITSINKNSTAIDENSKLISLKANQTDVDNIKGTAQQLSARLDVMAGEVKSKVDETRVNNIVDGKGYATANTVQSLITQKAGTINESITNLTNKVNSNNGGGVNLLQGTAKIEFPLNNNGGTQTVQKYDDETNYIQHTSNTPIDRMGSWCPLTPEIGQVYTLSADVAGNGYITGDLFRYEGGDTGSLSRVDLTDNWQRISNTFRVNTVVGWRNWIIYANNSTLLKVKHIKIERGSIATPWTPAPSDNATVTQVQSLTASIDGIQSTVANKADKSQITQLSNLVQSKVSTSDFTSKVSQLSNDINARVTKGSLLSQINIAAGHTLIQSNKIYFDADSFVMSPNSKAFIPSAYITNINADKITTGTLDAAKFNVKNFSADNIVGGTLSGVVVKTGANDRYFQTSKNNIYWVRNGSMSLVGNDTYLNSANGLNIADEKNIQLTTWGGATVNKDGSITNNSGNYGHPKIVIDREGNFNPDDPYGAPFAGGPGDSEIVQWVGNKEYTALTRGKGFTVHLNDGNNKSTFTIQKDNKVGVYVGSGDDGSEIRIVGPGSGSIKLQGEYIDDGFNDALTHTLGNLQVDNLHVRKWLGVDSNKNAIVKTSQGSVAINAYETAEYYFGDIGEGQTSTDGIAYIGIEKLFNETVNTTIPYHVFITAYGAGNIWVDQREH